MIGRNQNVTGRRRTAALVVGICGLAATMAAGSSIGVGAAAPCLADAPGLHRAEFRVSTFTPWGQEQSSVVAIPGDKGSHCSAREELVSVWSSRRQNAGKSGVFFQRMTREGVAIGEETRLGVWTDSHQRSPVAAATSDGFIAAWQSWGQDGEAGAIIARKFTRDASGALVGGDEVLVNATAEGDQTQPMLAIDRDGRVLVAWGSASLDGEFRTTKARVLDASLTPIGGEIDLTDGTQIRSNFASVAAASDPNSPAAFAVAYAATVDGMPDGIHFQLIGSDGSTVGEPRLISDTAGAIEPVLAATPSGFVACWADAGATLDSGERTAEYAAVVRRLDSTGAPLGDPMTVTGVTTGRQNAPTIAVASDGSFTVAFNAELSGAPIVSAQRFAADGSREGSSFAVTGPITGAIGGDQALDLSGSSRIAALRDGTVAVAWSGAVGAGDKNSANLTLLSPSSLDSGGAIAGVTKDMKPAPFDAGATAGTESAAAEPHVPPTFSPPLRDPNPRQVSYDGRAIGFDSVVNTGWTPPDPHMAVGPSHVVVMTNGAIAFHQKSDGLLTFQDQIEGAGGFWGAQGATGFVFDPEVLYDETTGRFFAMAAEAFAPGNRSYVLIAVSDDSNPNGNWARYRFDTTTLSGDLFDSPNIGVTDDAVIVTGDGFGITANYPVYTFRKSDMLAGIPTSIIRSTTLATTTQSAGIPPVSFDSPPAMYMVEHQEGTNRTQVRLIALTNPFTGPNFTTFNLTVPTYSAPGDPVQQGTTTRPESFDARFWSVAYRGGSLWAAHHVNNTVVSRWYQFSMNGWPTSGNNPTLVQSGAVAPPGNVNTTFVSITATPSKHVALSYAYSSSTNFLSMATSYRLACDAIGTMRDPVIRKVSNGAYNTTRWGDYSAVNVDPVDKRTFWAVHEYHLSGSWRTWVQSWTPEFCPGECPADFDGSGFVDTDDFDAFVDAFEAGLDIADFDGSGFVDTDDYDAFVKAFESGC